MASHHTHIEQYIREPCEPVHLADDGFHHHQHEDGRRPDGFLPADARHEDHDVYYARDVHVLANVITIGQNFLFKQFIDEEQLLRQMEARKVKPVKKSKFQQRLEDMAKQKGYKPPKKK
jgi:hypothetical protein